MRADVLPLRRCFTFLHPSRYLVYQCIGAQRANIKILLGEVEMATGQKREGYRPLGTQNCCGLSFSCCRRLEAGWSSCNGGDVRKDRVRAMVPYPNRLARGGRGYWPICASPHRLRGIAASCCDGGGYWIPPHNTGWEPCPAYRFASSCDLDRLVEQEDFTVGSAVHLNPTCYASRRA